MPKDFGIEGPVISASRIAELNPRLCIVTDISEVISIGDGGNDISALKTAGLGITVSNGSEEIKKIADVVGCSNDEHIAKYVLERYYR